MKKMLISALVVLINLICATSYAQNNQTPATNADSNTGYQVWMGMHTVPEEVATNTDSWALTAAKLDGVNCNRPPYKPNPNDPIGGFFHPSTDQDLQTIFAQIPASQRCLIELPASTLRDPLTKQLPTGQAFIDKVTSVLDSQFQKAADLGFSIKTIMFYNNRLADNVTYRWNPDQVDAMRQVLDNTGHADVSLAWDARNNWGDRAYAFNDKVNVVMMEAELDNWYTNLGDRIQLLRDLWTQTNKPIVFQIIADVSPYQNPTSYQKIREWVVWLGQQMGPDFLKSPRVIIEPVTYNWGPKTPHVLTFRFIPELKNSGTAYENSLTGIVLSLIEQKQMFMNGATVEQADSDKRDVTPPTTTATASPVANEAGWNHTDVTVNLQASDNENGSGVAKIVYSETGAQSLAPTEVANAAASISIQQEGVTDLGYYAQDAFLNTEAVKHVQIKLDKTAPDVHVIGNQEYTVDQQVKITCTASDSLSGLANAPCQSPLVDAPAYSLGLGMHQIQIQATDVAGNTTVANANYSVTVTTASLIHLAQQFVEGTGSQGIINSLTVKLQNQDEGAFIHEVSAQSGKDISESNAQLLIQFAQALQTTNS